MARKEYIDYSKSSSWWAETSKMVEKGYEYFWSKRGGRPRSKDFLFGKSEEDVKRKKDEDRDT